jgi:hypothetical protein
LGQWWGIGIGSFRLLSLILYYPYAYLASINRLVNTRKVPQPASPLQVLRVSCRHNSLFVTGLPVLLSHIEVLTEEASRLAIISQRLALRRATQKENQMGTKLYVGNLNFQTQESELREHFAEFGTVVSANIVNDRDTGRSRGFGFVEMTTEEEARSAESAMNGREVDGRTLKVNESKPRESRSGGGGRW